MSAGTPSRTLGGVAAGTLALAGLMILACGGLPESSDTLTPSDETVVLTPQELFERTALESPGDGAHSRCFRMRIFANVGASCSVSGAPDALQFTYSVEEFPFDSDAERGLANQMLERKIGFEARGYARVDAPGLLGWGDEQQCVYWEHPDGARVGPYCQARKANRKIVFDLEGAVLEGVVLDDLLADKLAAVDAWTP